MPIEEVDPSKIARSPNEKSTRCMPFMEGSSLPTLHRRLSTENEGGIIPNAFLKLGSGDLELYYFDGRGKNALGESPILRKEHDDPLFRDKTQQRRNSSFSKQKLNMESARKEKEDGKLWEVNGGAEDNLMEIDYGTEFSLL
ncbi:hypothetical protein U1Q18_004533 [Sarracenia purpurea var. burkii]